MGDRKKLSWTALSAYVGIGLYVTAVLTVAISIALGFSGKPTIGQLVGLDSRLIIATLIIASIVLFASGFITSKKEDE